MKYFSGLVNRALYIYLNAIQRPKYCKYHCNLPHRTPNYFTTSGFSTWRHTGVNKSKIHQHFIRLKNTEAKNEEEKRVKSILMYLSAVAVLVVGLSYAAVPMYRIFCQATSYGGEVSRDIDGDKVATMKKIANRQLKIQFNADTSSNMQWNFKPQQREIFVMPGDTALAFYTATNPTDKPVVGISTYNVIPFDAGQYFNKIQCFCFEEQRLNPHEQVDMPVFFYIDPEFAEDPKMENVHEIILSYTFFEARDDLKLPLPAYYRN